MSLFWFDVTVLCIFPLVFLLLMFSISSFLSSATGITNARSRNARLAAEEAAEEGGGGVSAAGPGGGAPPLLPVSAMEPASRWPRADAEARESDRRDLVVSEYLRQINWWFLVCFVLSSVWVSNGGTCVRCVRLLLVTGRGMRLEHRGESEELQLCASGGVGWTSFCYLWLCGDLVGGVNHCWRL